MRFKSITVLVFAVFFFVNIANAEMYAWKCDYTISGKVVFENGKYSKDKDSNMSFIITLDTESRAAYLTGNAGVSQVTPLVTGDQISFVQIEGNPPVIFTTLTTIYTSTQVNGKFPSAHSRHNRFNDVNTIGQYYGFCDGTSNLSR